MKNYFDCSGCGVCALVCPVWTQQADILLTPWGRAKAVQGGATALDIKDSLDSCVSCGACEVVCPETINVHVEEGLMRKVLGQIEELEEAVLGHHEIHFYPSNELQKQSEWLDKFKSQLDRHASKKEIITDHAPRHKNWLAEKKMKVYGLGEWLMQKKLIQTQIRPGDLYWMDARLFHNNYEKLVATYAKLSEATGCQLNWNLHRTAMPLGEENPYFERQKQYDWVVHNKKIDRLIVENVKDWQWLKKHSTYPVVHVLELLA